MPTPRLMLASVIFSVGAFASVGSAFTPVGTPVQWTTTSGGNGHYYQRVDIGADPAGFTYQQAVTAASALSYNGLPGHILDLENPSVSTYDAERDFVFNNVYTPNVTSNLVYWVGVTLPSGTSNSLWLSGDSVPSAINSTFNIDHNEGTGFEGLNYFQTNSDTLWDYLATDPTHFVGGYIVEYEPAPEPASLSILALASTVLLTRRKR